MKKIFFFAVLLASGLFTQAQTQTFHDFTGRNILGESVDLSSFHGKKVMVVNTASFCAFTPQFEDLQTLYETYQQNNFEIIGFPCNDFDNQDPAADSTILEFCTEEYGITFPMMSKIVAVQPDTAPVFRLLQEAALNGVADAPITWNFHKFLIDEAGHWVAHHSSLTSPSATSITDWIMSPSALGINDNYATGLALFNLNSTANGIEIRANATVTDRVIMDIYSADGKLVDAVYAGRLSDGQLITYTTASFPAGIYLLRATSTKGQQTLRFVVGG